MAERTTESDQVGLWKDKLEVCKKVWQPRQDDWRRYINYFQGNQWLGDYSELYRNTDRITVRGSEASA